MSHILYFACSVLYVLISFLNLLYWFLILNFFLTGEFQCSGLCLKSVRQLAYLRGVFVCGSLIKDWNTFSIEKAKWQSCWLLHNYFHRAGLPITGRVGRSCDHRRPIRCQGWHALASESLSPPRWIQVQSNMDWCYFNSSNCMELFSQQFFSYT